jgi:uncharacterized membrane protein
VIKANRVVSYPLLFVGITLVVIALGLAPWRPDYQNPLPNQTVSHQARLVGRDTPPKMEDVERRPNYWLHRGLDGLVYLALGQMMLCTLALVRTGDRFYLLLILAASLYGMIYAAAQGLVVGPQMTFIGFSAIFFAVVLEWLVNTTTEVKDESHSAA